MSVICKPVEEQVITNEVSNWKDYAPKSMAIGAATNVDINSEMDEVLKRIQVKMIGYYSHINLKHNF